MNVSNPLLRDDEFVAFSEIRPEHMLPAVRARIADYRARIEQRVADPAQHRFAGLMLAWEECEDAMNRCFAPVGHLHNVCDTPELRAVYGDAIELLTDFGTDIGQHAGLCAAVRAIRARADFDALPMAARKLVDDALLDFRLAARPAAALPRDRHRTVAPDDRVRTGRAGRHRSLDAGPARDRRMPARLARVRAGAAEAGGTRGRGRWRAHHAATSGLSSRDDACR